MNCYKRVEKIKRVGFYLTVPMFFLIYNFFYVKNQFFSILNGKVIVYLRKKNDQQRIMPNKS